MHRSLGPSPARLFLAGGVIWLAGIANALAEGPQAAPSDIAALIRDLGSERFAAREAASDQLARVGLPAFAALEEATRHSDREIRFRAERILTVIRKNDLERRLAAFVAGIGEDDYQLPGWTRFSKGYGDTEASRKLFVDMQRAEPELLAALERDPRAAVDVLGRRLPEKGTPGLRALNAAPTPPTTGEVAAYLFVAAEEDVAVSATSLSQLYLVAQQVVRSLVRMPKEGDITKQMVARVIRRCEVDASVNWIALARELELKEGLELALKVLENHKRFNPQSITTLTIALACVNDLGNQSHVPALEPLLENNVVLNRSSSSIVENGQRVVKIREMQVRDAALITLITLTKQDPKEYYGQELPPRARSTSPFSTFPAMVVSFEASAEGEAKRAAAHQKWAEYKAKQAKPADQPPGGGAP